MTSALTIGTRGSRLALWQAEWVRQALQQHSPSLIAELAVIKTQGDKIQDVPLAKVGGKGLFIKEIEEALLDGRIDLAVHSMKDMPAELPSGLCIGAVPGRETPLDALVSRNGLRLHELPPGARIGTSSLRRSSQLKHLRPDLIIVALRGNLDTRLRKLEDEGLDAVVLATAGIKRLDREDCVTEYLPETTMLPAVGQGALCIETRRDDARVAELVAPLEDSPTRTAVRGERAFLRRLEGSCQVPIAAYGTVQDGRLTLTGMVADVQGAQMFRDVVTAPAAQAEPAGVRLADRLLQAGARKILSELKARAGTG